MDTIMMQKPITPSYSNFPPKTPATPATPAIPATSTSDVKPFANLSLLDSNPKPVHFKSGDKPVTVAFRNGMPRVNFAPEALRDIAMLVELVGMEVGWLMVVERVKPENHFFVKNVFMADQKVGSSTTIINKTGQTVFDDLIKEKDWKTLNSIRGWGHSHVNMPINPSTQDDSQMEEFADNEDIGWFLRVIANKTGDIRVDVFLFDDGFEFHNVPWCVYDSHNEERTAFWKEQIKDKVVEIKPAKLPENPKALFVKGQKTEKGLDREFFGDKGHHPRKSKKARRTIRQKNN